MKNHLLIALSILFSTYTFSQVGINTTNPQQELDVNGNAIIRGALYDNSSSAGTNGQVLKSNTSGIYWGDENTNGTVILGNLAVSSSAVNISLNTPTYTGSTITLPPGRWIVTVTMLGTTGSVLNSSESYWIRTTLSDSPTNSTPTTDFNGGELFSGSLNPLNLYTTIYGSLIIDNTGTTNKTYYYWTAACEGYGTSSNLSNTLNSYGSAIWGENQIVAQSIN